MTAVPGGRAVDWSGILLRRNAGRDSTLVDVYQGKAGLVSTHSLGPPKDSQDVIDDAQTRDQVPKSSLLSLPQGVSLRAWMHHRAAKQGSDKLPLRLPAEEFLGLVTSFRALSPSASQWPTRGEWGVEENKYMLELAVAFERGEAEIPMESAWKDRLRKSEPQQPRFRLLQERSLERRRR
uniref:Uncharacterized protein n=1 Tax=Schizophyllum commune (strain H4-8 / FGSC 9210) TaxID=578458 RepID=D8QJM6_SCHCM